PSSWAERDDRGHAVENFFHGGSPKTRPPHFLARTSLTTRNRFTPNFQGWGLDENLKPKSPPYRGAHIHVRWQDKNEVGPRPAPPCCAPAPEPPSCIAIAMRSMQPFFVYDCAKKAYKLNSPATAGKVYPDEIGIQETHTKHRKLDSQTTLSHGARGRALMDCARKHGRYGHRDATMILVAYRHGLRASEVCDLQWQHIELSEGRLHVHRVKNGISSIHPIRGDELRALRKLRRHYPRDAYLFVSERGGPISPVGFHRLIQRLGEVAKMPFPIHPHMLRHACGFKLANDGHDTRALQHYLGHKNIPHGQIYRHGARPVQEFLEGLTMTKPLILG